MSKISRRKFVDGLATLPTAGALVGTAGATAARPPAGPEVLACKLNGREHRISHWTREQWEGTPRDARPSGALRGDQGGYFALAPERPFDADEELRALGIGPPATADRTEAREPRSATC